MVSLYTKFKYYVFPSELIVALGHYNSSSNNNRKAELLDIEGNNWSSADDYPLDWGLTYFLFL